MNPMLPRTMLFKKTGRDRGSRTPGDADQEHASLAIPVPKPAADHKQHAHGKRVASSEPLDQRLATADVTHD